MIYVFPLLLVCLALLQVTLVPALPLLGIRPDLVLLTVLAWTMVRGIQEGAVGAFVGGIVLDVLSPLPLGAHALGLLLVAAAVSWMATPAYRGNLLFPIVGTFLSTVLYCLLLLGLSQALGQGTVWGTTLWRIVLPLALVEATLMPLAYWILDRLDRRGHRRLRAA